MTPDALAKLTRRHGPPTYRVVRSRHLVWRWWVFLFCFGEEIDDKLCITWRGAHRFGRKWVESMEAVARSELQS